MITTVINIKTVLFSLVQVSMGHWHQREDAHQGVGSGTQFSDAGKRILQFLPTIQTLVQHRPIGPRSPAPFPAGPAHITVSIPEEGGVKRHSTPMLGRFPAIIPSLCVRASFIWGTALGLPVPAYLWGTAHWHALRPRLFWFWQISGTKTRSLSLAEAKPVSIRSTCVDETAQLNAREDA